MTVGGQFVAEWAWIYLSALWVFPVYMGYRIFIRKTESDRLLEIVAVGLIQLGIELAVVVFHAVVFFSPWLRYAPPIIVK